MIRSLKFQSGYPMHLPMIGTRRLEFSDRINILCGPNGTGKSTILRALAALSGCGAGGWSVSPGEASHDDLPFAAQVDADEQPIFYQDCYVDSDHSLLEDGYLEQHSFLRSTGEKRIGLINELVNHIEARFLTFKLPSNARPTLLLDEVDNHLGVVAQSLLWQEIVPLLSKKYQLIVATHSYFPLLVRRNNVQRVDRVFELAENYIRDCLAELAEAIDYYNTRGEGAQT